MSHRKTMFSRMGLAAALAAIAVPASSPAIASDRQYVYCVSSASQPGGNAYFSSIYPGTWEQSVSDEEAYYKHVAARVDEQVERSTTYCYVLDTFDSATLDKDSGMNIIRNQGWEPVETVWRP